MRALALMPCLKNVLHPPLGLIFRKLQSKRRAQRILPHSHTNQINTKKEWLENYSLAILLYNVAFKYQDFVQIYRYLR